MENVKSTLRNDPAIKNGLDRISKLDNMSEEEIAKTFDKGMDTVYYDIMEDIQEAMAEHSF
jgi:hypothetical protein